MHFLTEIKKKYLTMNKLANVILNIYLSEGSFVCLRRLLWLTLWNNIFVVWFVDTL